MKNMRNYKGGFSKGLIACLILFLSLTNIYRVQSQTLRINEFMALNQTTLMDEDGDYSDWIEIYNTSSSDVDLEDWSLTDDKNQSQKWVFPELTIGANDYLVLFASGKDRNDPANELHVNFKLSGAGEYFALFNPGGIAVSEFDPFFPEQLIDISFGYYENTYVGLTEPTPGSSNEGSGAEILPAPAFNKKHGFYDTSFDLEISSGIQNTDIYYTTDGSFPAADNGTLYTSPININSTAIIRAVTVMAGKDPSKVTTQTYLFPDDIINQPNDPPGYPAEWGPYTAIAGTAIADYEMDPEMMVDPGFADSVKEALLDIPTLSLVTDKNLLFSHVEDPDTGGIYIYTGPPIPPSIPPVFGVGDGWERPVSVEYFNAGDSNSFQIDCGLRIQGGHSRRPEKSPKHSFRLAFRSMYGPSKLNYPIFGDEATSSFNTIVLRAGFCNTWVHHGSSQRNMAQYVRDPWSKDVLKEMGHVAGHGNFVHLYLNGLYWGLYNPTERIDRRFAVSYLNGDDEDYDVIKDYGDYHEVVDGESTAWDNLVAMANAGLANNEYYQRILGNNPDGTPNPGYPNMIDIENFIDYMIINFYGSNTDWDGHNWAALRNRVEPGKGFKFICWDEEHILENVYTNVLGENNDECPSRLFQKLRENEVFLRLFANRVQKHCFNNGLLTPQRAADRWMTRINQVQKAVFGESARWGDYRRDVHQYQTSGPFDLYTKEDHWLPQLNFMNNTYFPDRTDAFINQLRNANLFPNIDAPVFMINGNPVSQNTISVGDILSMSSLEGTIYYTTDGNDPAAWPELSENTVLIAESADKKVIVPKSDIGSTWRSDVNYNTSGWQLCSGSPGGIGYEKNSGYEDLITLDVGNDMHDDGGDPNTSCYIRILFDLSADDLSAINTLILNVRYDDGFAAYLNGTKVAERNAPGTLSWNSAASGGHEASSAETFYITDYIGDLSEGSNLLAIHGLNLKTSSSDFIIMAELQASEQTSAGNSSPNAIMYSDEITLNESSHIKARTFLDGEWSALSDRFFIIPDNFYDLKITEIHYHPFAQDTISSGEFEFVELKNTGTSTLDLGGLQLIKGVEYEFPPETELKPKEFIVLASNSDYFFDRYGFLPFDDYGGQLSNNGEWVVLISNLNDTLCSFIYDDENGWPLSPDGLGNSLVPTNINPENDQKSPDYWRASYAVGGSPGADDLITGNDPVEKITAIENFTLSQNYPNPFSGVTYINYRLPSDAQVQLSVYNIIGQNVITLVNKRQSAGLYQVEWNGINQNNNKVTNGIYFYRIAIKSQHQNKVITRKMMIMN